MKRIFLLPAAAIVLIAASCTKTVKINHDLPLYEVKMDDKRQVLDGIGSSMTESSAYVLACLDPADRKQVLADLYGEQGANFSLVRTHIGACDFTLDGHYSLVSQENDTLLQTFSLDVNKDGFSSAEYPDIVDENFDLYQMIMEVDSIKKSQSDSTLRLMATAWTAPYWMKDNQKYFDKPNKYGGALLKKYYNLYSEYLLKYLQAYKEAGVDVWAISPENEPMGNDGSWESMHFTPQEEAELIGQYLGPILETNGFGDVKILGFDQNVFEVGPWTEAIYGDSSAKKYTYGMALHWYGSTYTPFPEVLDSIHALYPDKVLIHTEGCIDNLGCDAWPGVSDPAGFKESGWFMNDSFWWNANATDWAYSTPFWPEWHPKYITVHRYARFIIEGFNHWLTGFTDWNVVLDSQGGPTHVGNYCGAPVMIDTKTKEVYYTPVYDVLCLLSRAFRPGDRIVYVEQSAELADKVFVCAAEKPDGRIMLGALNTTEEPVEFNVKLGGKYCTLSLNPKAVQTALVSIK